MDKQEFALTGYSSDNPMKYAGGPSPGGIDLERVNQNKTSSPGGVEISTTMEQQEKANQMVRSYLKTAEDPDSEKAKIEVSQFLSITTGVPFQSIFENYDANMEHILGYTLKPKKALTFIKDQFKTEQVNYKIAELYTEIERKPGEDHTQIMNEIEQLEKSKPAYDPYKHNWFIDATGIAAGMIPYTWEVGKSLIPSMAVGAVAGALSGGTGAVLTASQVLDKVAKLTSIWGKAQSFREGYKAANGMLFGSLMQMKDEEGNSLDEGIARKVSLVAGLPIAGLEAIGAEWMVTGNSVFKNIISKMGRDIFNKTLEKSTAKTLTSLSVKGVFEKLAKDTAKRMGEGLLYEVVLEEVPQGIIEMEATELVKNFTNELKGTKFVEAAPTDWENMIKDTLIQSAKGILVLTAGRSMISNFKTLGDYTYSRTKAGQNQQAIEDLAEEDNIIDFATKANEMDYKIFEEAELAKVQAESKTKVNVDITKDSVTAKDPSGKQVGKLNYSVKGDTVVIDSIESSDVTMTEKMVQELGDKAIGKKVVFNEDTTGTLGRAVENLNPEIKAQNVRIDNAKQSVDIANKEIEQIVAYLKDLEDKQQTEDVLIQREQAEAELQTAKENLQLSEQALKEAQEAKLELIQPKQKPIHQMTAEEYKVIQHPSTPFKDSQAAIDLKSQLAERGYSKEQQDVSIALLEMAADAKGISTEQWISDTFKDGVVRDQKKGEKRASVTFFENGKAIINLPKKTTFSAWVHELGHILRTQLNPEDYKIAQNWAKNVVKDKLTKRIEGYQAEIAKIKDKNSKRYKLLKTGIKETVNQLKELSKADWNEDMEEAFAEGFERFVYEGKVEDSGIKAIFIKLAKFMRAIYNSIKHKPELSDEIRKVFENQLTSKRIETMENEALELFQPEYRDAVKDAVEKGYDVSESILKQFDEDWAKKAIEQKKVDTKALEEFGWMVDLAKEARDVEDFISAILVQTEGDLSELGDIDKEWLEHFYEIATREDNITDINTGNRQWAENLDDAYVRGVIEDISKNLKEAKDAGVSRRMIASAIRYASKGEISESAIQIAKTTMQNNPGVYREAVSSIINDLDELRRIDMEKQFSESIGVKEEIKEKVKPQTRLELAEEIDDIVLKKKIRKAEITTRELNSVLRKSSKEIKKADEEINKLEDDLKERDQFLTDRLKAIKNSRERELKKLKDEKRQAIKDAIKKERARKNELLKKQREAKKAKDHMRKLAKQITRKIPGTVDISYHEAIKAIQDSIDPSFRTNRKLSQKKMLREFYRDHPELASVMPEDFIRDIGKLSLNELTIGELENMKTKIDVLIDMGKAELQAKETIRKAKNQATLEELKTELLEDIKEDNRVFTKGEGKTFTDKAKEVALTNSRPSRVADMFDGGKDFKGAMFRLMFEEVNESYNNELKAKHKRQMALGNKMKALGLKEKDLYRSVEVRGEKITIDQIMDIYAGWKNERKRNALIGGNNITESIMKEMVGMLSDKEIELADYIVQDYEDNFIRLKDAFRKDKNMDIDHEEFYTPIKRVIGGLVKEELDTAEELINRQRYSAGASLMKNFAKKRIDPSLEHQPEISLGLLSTWMGAVAQQEHYINNIDVVKRMNSILADRELNKMAQLAGKKPHLDYLKDYSKVYANPTVDKSMKGIDPIVRMVKNNAAVAYLGFNLVTMMKQPVSILYYMTYASPPDLMASTTEVIRNWKNIRSLMDTYSPQLTYGRSLESFLDRLKTKDKNKVMNKIKKFGYASMKGIELFDSVTVTIGWNAVYRKYIRNGYSQADAAKMAEKATLFTQPTSAAKDVAPLYRDDNFLSVFLQFSNQLNQIWNMISYDASQAIKHKHYEQAVMTWAATLAGAMAMWILSNRRLPEDKEDFTEAAMSHIFNIMPGVGRTMGNYVDGYDLSVPILAPVKGSASGITLAHKILAGEKLTKKQLERYLLDMAEGMGVLTGIPTTELTRIYKGFEEGQPIQFALTGGKINDKQ